MHWETKKNHVTSLHCHLHFITNPTIFSEVCLQLVTMTQDYNRAN